MAKRKILDEEEEGPEFNQKALAAWKPGPTRRIFWDPTTPGLGLRVFPPNAKHPKGSKVYYFVYRMGGRGTKLQWLPMSDFDDLPLVRARELARGYRTQRDNGIDPAKALDAVAQRGKTIAEACTKFMEEYAPKNLKPNSISGYQGSIDKHIIPAFGKTPVRELTRDRISSWHSKKSKEPVGANRALAVLSSIMTQCELWGWRPMQECGPNPCIGVDRFPEQPRIRDIERSELAAVGSALRELEAEGRHSVWALAAIRVIGLCGGRVSEVLQLSRGKDTRLDQGVATIRDHKGARRTGAKRLELPPAAIQILQRLPEENGNPWYFPGRMPGSHITRHGLHKVWMAVRERAGIPDMHLHDFRSFAASESLDKGIATKVAAAILGHDPRTTERHYQRARDKRVAEAAAQISAPVAQAFGLEPKPQPSARRLLRRGFERVKVRREG